MKIGQVEVTEEQMTKLLQSMYATWGNLASDAGPCSKSEAIELCVDANRLRDYPANDVASDELVGAICKYPGGFAALSKALAKRFHP